ncbi:MAG TPA: TetR family transcriptional regulator [Anaerolineales bacterium]|jgi:AcrR family transcriptional regulator|nr:TetR family transcriptional regulator [Anaerolineales bacterium]HNA87688.1 TetR family transcriptional regulator [Anaerolineales bacterium]HNB34661.1 TetR family transcriptional regulator [Anaerolineales bacterium]HNC07660.1 TetR family transcriptional regulator [Anaerolineales bacterium]HNJ11963.1 TetR family transcriptional regulator [Anaerolineales bacterium]
MLTTLPEEKLDPRVKRTRQLVEQAFTQLIREKEFQSISVQDISERAEINRATFYAHFPDKYALLDYKIRQEFRAEIEKRTLNACHFSEDNLRALILTVCEFIGEANSHCKSPHGQFGPIVEAQVKEQIRDLLMTWLAQVESNVPSEILATAASWAIYGLAQYWNDQKDRVPVNEYVERILPLAIANLQLSRA